MNHRRAQIFALSFSMSFASSCGHKASRNEADKATLLPNKEENSPMLKKPYRQFLVAFETLPTPSERQQLWDKHRVKEIEQVGKNALILVEASPTVNEKDLEQLRLALAAEKGVRYAEPNVQIRLFK